MVIVLDKHPTYRSCSKLFRQKMNIPTSVQYCIISFNTKHIEKDKRMLGFNHTSWTKNKEQATCKTLKIDNHLFFLNKNNNFLCTIMTKDDNEATALLDYIKIIYFI